MQSWLAEDNWEFTAAESMTSDLQGATPGHGQEYPEGMHPHLELDKTMIHVPEVRPGDFVVWHCDSKSSPSIPASICADESWLDSYSCRRQDSQRFF
jgi:hypothetical protein